MRSSVWFLPQFLLDVKMNFILCSVISVGLKAKNSFYKWLCLMDNLNIAGLDTIFLHEFSFVDTHLCHWRKTDNIRFTFYCPYLSCISLGRGYRSLYNWTNFDVPSWWRVRTTKMMKWFFILKITHKCTISGVAIRMHTWTYCRITWPPICHCWLQYSLAHFSSFRLFDKLRRAWWEDMLVTQWLSESLLIRSSSSSFL